MSRIKIDHKNTNQRMIKQKVITQSRFQTKENDQRQKGALKNYKSAHAPRRNKRICGFQVIL